MLIRKESFKVAAVASSEKCRPQLNGVHVFPDGTCEATDGHCLVRVHTPVRQPVEDYPAPVAGWTAPQVPAEGFILATADAKACAKLAPKGRGVMPIMSENVLLESLNGRAKLVATDLDRWNTVDARPVEGVYPALDKVFPAESELSAGTAFNPRLLAKALTTLADALDLEGDYHCEVVLRMGKHGAMRLDARNSNGGQGTALVMPLNPHAETFIATWPVQS